MYKQRGVRRSAAPSRRSSVSDASSESHRKTRLARAEELAEDYVEVIDGLIAAHGEARVVAIAERLGVTHVTVTRTIARLQKQGLVQSERYRSIFLSEAGRRLAARVRRRHALVLSFLEAIGVDRATAQVDAEGIEHYVSEATLRAFKRFCGMKLSTKQRIHLRLEQQSGVRKGVACRGS
jgi:DtxR family manganese transport transcriptional regulator